MLRPNDLHRAKHDVISISGSLAERKLVGLTRFELVTPRLSSVCSNQLSYRPSILAFKRFKEPLPVLSKLDRRAIHKTLRARSIIELGYRLRVEASAFALERR